MAYRIRITRGFYGYREEVSYDCGENGYEPVIYKTREEAEARVAELDGGVYHLAHDECQRPDYRVVRAR